MTTRRPMPNSRRSRAQLEQAVDSLTQQRELAIGQARAQRDRLAAWLEQRADAHLLDARHERTPEGRRAVHRAVADELRQAAIDVGETR